MLVIVYEPKTLLEKRFAKTSAKKESMLESFGKYFYEKIKPFTKRTQTADYVSKSKKLLLQAGYACTEEDIIRYDTKKLTNTFMGLIFCVFYLITVFSTNTFIICILFLFLLYRWPEIKLKREIKQRQKEFMRHLPDAVDLLAICVQAGLGLDAAFEKVADEFRITSPVVSSEFSRLNNDILSGLNREEAYKNLILRNESQDLQSFIALLIQTDKLGTSITQSLDAFCDSMRTKKRQRVEELSQQASTKMTIPMVLFMLPSIMIIILYPALQKIMTNLGH